MTLEAIGSFDHRGRSSQSSERQRCRQLDLEVPNSLGLLLNGHEVEKHEKEVLLRPECIVEIYFEVARWRNRPWRIHVDATTHQKCDRTEKSGGAAVATHCSRQEPRSRTVGIRGRCLTAERPPAHKITLPVVRIGSGFTP